VEELREVLRDIWGYESFRPGQAAAMQAVLEGRDSLVVLPTGGGKSICYQAPAMCLPGVAVVVSPLIALMKDQVDGLIDSGVPAAFANSTSTAEERQQVAEGVRNGTLKLLYLSPERLMTERTLEFLKGVSVSFLAIDEAHCISEWGHDFRPVYRELKTLKEHFPGVPIHSYTATATKHVRDDIVRELKLVEPELLVGSFDRPNLVYRVQRRGDLLGQVLEVAGRYPEDSGVIYSIRRDDVEMLAEALQEKGIKALPYHAGLAEGVRKENQEAFINDRARVMVATVAFGMGIDKSNVRYVIHAAAPKSLENYQQESGRAGRDGLEAECWLLYSSQDLQAWRKMQQNLPEPALGIAMELLKGIDDYASGSICRHRAIARYFGQDLEGENCGACDICLSEVELVDDCLITAQKILSCVVRLRQSFGGEYTSLVLTGSRDLRIIEKGHDQLSTWGILKEHPKQSVRNWIEQLVGQGFLAKVGEYNTLEVTATGEQLLRGEGTPRLLKPASGKRKKAKVAVDSWEGVDEGLFEKLRGWRREKAEERGIPPYVVFTDATLRELARMKPATPEQLLEVQGIGLKKASDYGAEVLNIVVTHGGNSAGVGPISFAAPAEKKKSAKEKVSRPSPQKQRAWKMFGEGMSIAEVREAAGVSHATVLGYLADYIEHEGIVDPERWVPTEVFARIKEAAERVGFQRLKPLYEVLDGGVSYDQIHPAVACLRNLADQESSEGD